MAHIDSSSVEHDDQHRVRRTNPEAYAVETAPSHCTHASSPCRGYPHTAKSTFLDYAAAFGSKLTDEIVHAAHHSSLGDRADHPPRSSEEIEQAAPPAASSSDEIVDAPASA